MEVEKQLYVSGLQFLRQFDYPWLPKNFPPKIAIRAKELARLIFYDAMTISDAFSEIKRFVHQEVAKLYLSDD